MKISSNSKYGVSSAGNGGMASAGGSIVKDNSEEALFDGMTGGGGKIKEVKGFSVGEEDLVGNSSSPRNDCVGEGGV
jgi:hypothetical protein